MCVIDCSSSDEHPTQCCAPAGLQGWFIADELSDVAVLRLIAVSLVNRTSDLRLTVSTFYQATKSSWYYKNRYKSTVHTNFTTLTLIHFSSNVARAHSLFNTHSGSFPGPTNTKQGWYSFLLKETESCPAWIWTQNYLKGKIWYLVIGTNLLQENDTILW